MHIISRITRVLLVCRHGREWKWSAVGLVHGLIGKDESEGVHTMGMGYADGTVKQLRLEMLRGCEDGLVSPL